MNDFIALIYALAAVVAIAYCALPFVLLRISKKIDHTNKLLADIAFNSEELKKIDKAAYFLEEIELQGRNNIHR